MGVKALTGTMDLGWRACFVSDRNGLLCHAENSERESKYEDFGSDSVER